MGIAKAIVNLNFVDDDNQDYAIDFYETNETNKDYSIDDYPLKKRTEEEKQNNDHSLTNKGHSIPSVEISFLKCV